MAQGESTPPIDEATLQALASLIPSPVLIARLGMPLAFANSAACALFGWSAGEMGALRRDDVFDVHDPRFAVASERLAESGHFKGHLRMLGVEPFEAEITSARFATSDAPLLWIAVRDLRAETALREREEELAALNDATVEALVVHQDGVIRAANRATRELFLLPADGAVGQQLLDYVAPEHRDAVRKHTASGGSEPYEAIGRRSDGTLFPVAVQARTTVFRGRPARLAAIRDLSELRRMQSSLAFADRMASVGTLAAGVAHEINNPLTFVAVNIDDVARKLESKPELSREDVTSMIELLGDAKVGATRVASIVRDLRSFSRAEDESTGPVDVAAVIAYAARMAQVEIRHRATLTLDVQELPPVVGSEPRLGQVFLNLLVNAAHSIPQGAADRNAIKVSASAQGDSVVVEVSDTGVGIEPTVRERIFDPFVTTKSQGMGLGLAICYGIVTGLGGDVSVDSVVGRGTTFRVRLPISRDGIAVSSDPASGVAKTLAARPRVLIVDDEPMLLRTAERVLEDDCDVVTAPSAKRALAEIEKGPPFDVVLCDLLMPEMTGMALFDALRELHPALCSRVVFLTGGVFTNQAAEFLARTPRPRIDKPFTIHELRDAVESVVTEHTSLAKRA